MDPPLDELGLDAEALRPEAEMLRLRDQHFHLAKRAEEVKARKDASAERTTSSWNFGEELSGMMYSRFRTRNEKSCGQLRHSSVKSKGGFRARGVLNQLASKVNGVNAM